MKKFATVDIALLHRLATTEIDPGARAEISRLVSGISNWMSFIASAEKHGLTNLVYHHLTQLKIDFPADARHQFIALKTRHRRANLARRNAVEEILDIFSQHKIDSIFLKGTALVNVLYTSPELRPMSDIDILVPSEQGNAAQQSLIQIGYDAEPRKTGYLADHHHLPVATKTIESTPIHIEIHLDALSGDVNASISFDNLNAAPRPFAVGEQTGHALGHTDMLRHLCHHTFEPVEELKLGAVADLYGYASKYIAEIDQQQLDKKYSFVQNIFSLLHYVSPLPKKLHSWIAVPEASPPTDVGLGFPPMSHTLAVQKGILNRARHLLIAPNWWLHCFYNVQPGHSLLFTRLIRHPATIGKWLFRRCRAKIKDRYYANEN